MYKPCTPQCQRLLKLLPHMNEQKSEYPGLSDHKNMNERRKIIFQQYWCQWETCWWKKWFGLERSRRLEKQNQVRTSWAKEFSLLFDSNMLWAWECNSLLVYKQEKGSHLKAFLIKKSGNNLPLTLCCQRKRKFQLCLFLHLCKISLAFVYSVSIYFKPVFGVLAPPF